MRNSHQPQRGSWLRWLIAPTIVGLISASLLAGYAGKSLWSGVTHHSRLVFPLQLAGFGPQDSGARSSDDTSAGADDPLENYKTALALLKKDYYGTPIDAKKTQTLTYEAIRGMLDTLKDQFTSSSTRMSGRRCRRRTRRLRGNRAILQQDPNTNAIKIVKPIEGSPAEKLGIKSDDEITRVDGKSVIGKDINDVVRVIKGPRGTMVKITVLRGKQTLEFNIKRALVEPPVVKYWMEDTQNKIGHIVLKEFNEKSIEQLDRAFNDLNKQGMRALVFDLRYNPGGLLTVAIEVASIFIPRDTNKDLDNTVVWVREGTGKETGLQLKNSDDSYKPMPLIVLTNKLSASASEIVSGAIKDYGVGTLLGEHTFGKGLVQTLLPARRPLRAAPDDRQMLTPKHTDINRKHDADGYPIENSGGILPDILVKQPDSWENKMNFNDKAGDVQLQKALEFLRDRLNGMNVAQATEALQEKPTDGRTLPHFTPLSDTAETRTREAARREPGELSQAPLFRAPCHPLVGVPRSRLLGRLPSRYRLELPTRSRPARSRPHRRRARQTRPDCASQSRAPAMEARAQTLPRRDPA